VLRGVDDEVLRKAREAVLEALAPFSTPEGVRMKCAAHIVRASKSL
jgi:hypothetical protein